MEDMKNSGVYAGGTGKSSQICLIDIFPEERRFTSKSCAAALEVCTHEPGTCAERCCQYCNTPCGSICGYSVKQPEVKAGNMWMKNPDFVI